MAFSPVNMSENMEAENPPSGGEESTANEPPDSATATAATEPANEVEQASEATETKEPFPRARQIAIDLHQDLAADLSEYRK